MVTMVSLIESISLTDLSGIMLIHRCLCVYRLVCQLPPDSGVFAFPSNYLSRVILNADPYGVVNEIQTFNVNILECRLLLMPLIIGDHRCLLVLYNPGLALSNESAKNSFMMLLDSSDQSIVDKKLISRRVRSWLNRILVEIGGSVDGNRYTESNFQLHEPQGNIDIDCFTNDSLAFQR